MQIQMPHKLEDLSLTDLFLLNEELLTLIPGASLLQMAEINMAFDLIEAEISRREDDALQQTR